MLLKCILLFKLNFRLIYISSLNKPDRKLRPRHIQTYSELPIAQRRKRPPQEKGGWEVDNDFRRSDEGQHAIIQRTVF